MIVRIFIGVGLFALGYFLGKEMGSAESVRDQLSWAAEEDDRIPTAQHPDAGAEPETPDPPAAERGGS